MLASTGCLGIALVPYEPRFPEAESAPLSATLSLTEPARAARVDDHGWSLLRVYEFATDCPESASENASAFGPAHRGVLELFDGEEAGPAALPVGRYVVLRGEYTSPGAISTETCFAHGGFVPRPKESYRATFELGTGSCRLRVQDASDALVPLDEDQDECPSRTEDGPSGNANSPGGDEGV